MAPGEQINQGKVPTCSSRGGGGVPFFFLCFISLSVKMPRTSMNAVKFKK